MNPTPGVQPLLPDPHEYPLLCVTFICSAAPTLLEKVDAEAGLETFVNR